MTLPAPIEVSKPYTLKTGAFYVKLLSTKTISNFSLHVGECRFTPTTSSSAWTGMSGNVIQNVAKAQYAMTLGLVQDLESSGFMRYLADHDGEKAQCLVIFEAETEPAIVTVTLSPTEQGSKADGSIAESTVTLPMDGAPVYSPTAATTFEGA